MNYQSKKNEAIVVRLDSIDAKYKTAILTYLTGPDTGKTFSVSDATLKRWYRKVKEEIKTADEVETPETPDEVDNTTTLEVTINNEETGEVKTITIDPNAPIDGVDNSDKTYYFNTTENEKTFVEMPDEVKKIYNLGNEVFPDIEELVDKLVEWGADVKSFTSFIKLADNTKIIYRKDKIVLRFEQNPESLTSYTAELKPVKGALLYKNPYCLIANTMHELETIIRELYTNK